MTYSATCQHRASLTLLLPQPHQQAHSHAVQQNSQQHLFSKSARSLLPKPKQRGSSPGSAIPPVMRAAAFPLCQSISLQSDSSTMFYLQTLSGNYFYKVCKNNVREFIYHGISVLFSLILPHRIVKGLQASFFTFYFLFYLFNSFCSLLEIWQGVIQSRHITALGSEQPKEHGVTPLIPSTCALMGLHTTLLNHHNTPTNEEHNTAFVDLSHVSGDLWLKGRHGKAKSFLTNDNDNSAHLRSDYPKRLSVRPFPSHRLQQRKSWLCCRDPHKMTKSALGLFYISTPFPIIGA